MSKYCTECQMLSYDNEKCTYCGKDIYSYKAKTKIEKLQEESEKENYNPNPNLNITRNYNTSRYATKCETCKHQISTKTIQCPSCGEIKYWKLIKLILTVGLFFTISQAILATILYKLMY